MVFVFFLLPGTSVLADFETLCRIKSVGQRVFVLDKGIFQATNYAKTNLEILWIGAPKQIAIN